MKNIIFKIGQAIKKQPKKYVELLKKYDSSVTKSSNINELSEKTISLIKSKNKEFIVELAEFIYRSEGGKTPSNINIESNYVGYNNPTGSLSFVGTDEPFYNNTGDPEVTIGADPISAIAGAIGSVFSFATSSQEAKAQEEQQKHQLMLAILSDDPNEVQKTKTRSTVIILAVVGSILLIGVVLILTLKKKK